MTRPLSAALLTLCLFALPCCGQPAPVSGDQARDTAPPSRAEPQGVSLIALIANPRSFHGERVRVVGYLHLEFEGDTLWISKADYDASINKNAVWVDVRGAPTPRDVSDSYVILEGTFDAESTGHLGLNSGSIKNLSRLERWVGRSERASAVSN